MTNGLTTGIAPWSFLPDYEQRVSEALIKLAEEYARQNDQSQ